MKNPLHLFQKISLKSFLENDPRKVALISLLIGGILGALLFSPKSQHSMDMKENSTSHQGHKHSESMAERKIATWTCSMHPQIQKDKPGQCPLCGMDLIPIENNMSEHSKDTVFEMSEAAQKLAEISTTKVERKIAEAKINLNGTINYDETKVEFVTARVGGRIDRMFVDYTGVNVKRGDHMVYLYSPELISAQEEMIQAIKNQASIETITATKERLRLWGLTRRQVERIAKQKKATDHTTITSPTAGIVIKKHVSEGAYVKTGDRIYTIADLSKLWVEIEAYESDLRWVRYGQYVEFSTAAHPGEKFHGQVSFVDPVLNPKTRTVKLRVNVSNEEGKLKPGMFVRASIKSNIASVGPVADASMKGKWISPMHPEIIKDGPGKCDVCGMALVPIETLGYISDPKQEDLPLVIPVSAPLLTGERAIVYVRVPNADRPTFEGREIHLGSRAGDYYIVKHGLSEGEEVVTKGNFKIDSSLQIQAKPSMMNPDGGKTPSEHNH
ncbi:MAG TPA: efflux RND transporter periplasmic adaptor subunit [Oligoflexia bacterium]|nr:efflux RND transporter periplasmic adaptor subunit [bacterium]HMQ11362.1 efflux RND transporter periplasmic adaptor subunit [Oligoflexia bacterium]HMR24072.1 efflux RND transporter periplasmic adaptor subunit [Oligoflexia bacterium]